MCDNKAKIEILKEKLKFVTKITMIKEGDVSKHRNNEGSIIEELSSIKMENAVLKEKVELRAQNYPNKIGKRIYQRRVIRWATEELRCKIVQTTNQISMIEICKTSEKVKTEAHIDSLTLYGESFQQFFDKERDLIALLNKESKMKEKEEEQIMEMQIAEKNEQLTREISIIELEYESIEQECAVLKKRNNAIMLKLKRKLLETENTRRELMKRCGET